ncbi:MAG: 16S rRNA (cytosine(1402)-N(4))-methyltransferase RsmH [Actinomycetota bacterium]|nr:16S rRNA (cytosine(1402)-N(4))-methyltransferase RsmH [Actinomycetota bacterium]
MASGTAQHHHTPVLLHRISELLDPAISVPGAVLVDATLGLGGHAAHLLATHPQLRLIGLDRDPNALTMAADRLTEYGDRTTLVHTVYDGIPDALEQAGLGRGGLVHGVLFDLGVSSMQLDATERGFAYAKDAPLDMRMDPTTGITAAEVLNTYPHGQLARVLSTYGEERFAGRIASEVLRQREREPFTTSARLVEAIYASVPAATRRTGGHPAKRTFQALRIEVNGELDALRAALPAALDALAVGGRMAVMSYQSLEDRVTKHELAPRLRSRTPQDLPVELPGQGAELRSLTRGAERATEAEIDDNPRAAPVRLRAVQRISRRPA